MRGLFEVNRETVGDRLRLRLRHQLIGVAGALSLHRLQSAGRLQREEREGSIAGGSQRLVKLQVNYIWKILI